MRKTARRKTSHVRHVRHAARKRTGGLGYHHKHPLYFMTLIIFIFVLFLGVYEIFAALGGI